MNIAQKPDLIRQEYKRYKKKKPPPDFSDVIDIRTSEPSDRVTKTSFAHRTDLSADACKVGLRNPAEWDAFLVQRCPGFMIISNPFFPAAQRYWSYKALTEYAMKPYPCNLDIHIEEKERENLWKARYTESSSSLSSSSSTLIDRLRWAHLGYHFDYNFVNYREEKYYGFPEDLALLMKVIADIIGHENYIPETAIVNYYPIGSSMGGHTDHYEEELDAPLLSISFGQPCVFLIGGPTKDVKPEAIWIKSGDLVVMANESRVAFHAVPCIVKESANDEPPEPLKLPIDPEDRITDDLGSTIGNTMKNNSVADKGLFNKGSCYCGSDNYQDHLWSHLNMSSNEWGPIAKYLSKNRININVRQVHRR